MKSPVPLSGRLFILSGPSGSGKTTLARRILRDPQAKKCLRRSVSCTTRPRRAGEREGRDYFFVSAQRFRALQKAKKILEWTRYLGYYYGTPRAFVQQQLARGRNLILCLDYRGVRQVKRAFPRETVSILVGAPSEEVLAKRIGARKRETAAREIGQRLALARQEMRRARKFDYLLINDRLALAIQELKKIIRSNVSHFKT